MNQAMLDLFHKGMLHFKKLWGEHPDMERFGKIFICDWLRRECTLINDSHVQRYLADESVKYFSDLYRPTKDTMFWLYDADGDDTSKAAMHLRYRALKAIVEDSKANIEAVRKEIYDNFERSK